MKTSLNYYYSRLKEQEFRLIKPNDQFFSFSLQMFILFIFLDMIISMGFVNFIQNLISSK